MEALVIGTTLVGSFWGAYVLQKYALRKLFRIDSLRRAEWKSLAVHHVEDVVGRIGYRHTFSRSREIG